MKSPVRISDTEWEIMRVVWARHPLTAAEIIERLAAIDGTWHPKTARTLLARLVQKGALGYEPLGRAYAYSPLVSETECMSAASESFVARVFGGSLRPMLTHLVETQKLSPEELDDLRALLAKKSAEERKSPKGRASS